MRPLPLALLPAFLLAACVGQLRDFVGPVSNTTSPQLLRFGLDLAQARCVGTRLGDQLRPRQLRMFARAMGGVREGWFERDRLTLRDLSYLAEHGNDRAFGPALQHAVAACNVAPPAPPPVVTIAPPSPPARAAAPARQLLGPTWLNLGAAASGQSIAINAGTIEQEGNQRTAWFRLAAPETGPSHDTFQLQIDCAHRTINAKAREHHDDAGAVTEHVEFPDHPIPVEGGTVMEIAWLSLCT